MIYLDNGATSFPKPVSVKNKINQSLSSYSANPGRSGHKLSLKAAKEIFECRKSIKNLFNVKSEEEVIFTLNCTMALNTVIFGTVNKGDNVIISSMEHNSVTRPLEELKKEGITYSVFDYSYNNDEIINNVRELIKPETKLVVCTHASNVFGFRFPIERLCALCHTYGILFCVDAAQSAGLLNIDMEKDGYDFVCMAGHKGLYGPMGTGVLLLGNHRLKPMLLGGTGTESIKKSQPNALPEKFESGTQNMNGIAGLRCGVDFVKERGIEKLYNHEYSLGNYLYWNLKKIPMVKLYTRDFTYGEYVPVISFNIADMHSEEVVAILDKFGICARGGLHCSPLAHSFMGTLETGTVRIVPGAFNTKAHINKLIAVVKEISRNNQKVTKPVNKQLEQM